VWLTFDDGPDPEGTPAVLDALASAGAVATFFLLTSKAAQAPGMVGRIVAAGHEVALHSDVHDPLDRVPIRPLAVRLSKARDDLAGIAGRPVTWHRPPYGRVSWRLLQAARQAAMGVALWSHDPRDWEPRAPRELARDLEACLQPGAIVLLHDGSDGFPGQGRHTAEVVAEVLPQLGDLGLRPARLSELA
jgi:peptidoglycan/xylan/chitin deacetylase (PgdA/CDA1 family)